MLTKLGKILGSVFGTIMAIMVLIAISIIGVAVIFVGYFFFWGIIGLLIAGVIAFVIWAAVTEYLES